MGIRATASGGMRRSAGLAVIGMLLAPGASAIEILYAEASYEHRETGSADGDANTADSGAVMASSTGPSFEAFGPARGQAYSDEGGTFWVSAQAGTVDPFATSATAVWQDAGVRMAGVDAAFAEITGATLELVDWGSQYNVDLYASIHFEAMLNGVSLFSHDVRLEGRGGSPDSFELTMPSLLPGATETSTTLLAESSDYVYSQRYQLHPLTAVIDLGGIAIGDPFTLRYTATARAANIGGETYASAWFRDPLSLGGGISVAYGSADGTTEPPVSAVPEPGTAYLLAAGLLVLAGSRRALAGA